MVQGVGFRYLLKDVAAQFEVTGYAKNKQDGTVEAVLQGDAEEVGRIIEVCRRGPSMASVERVEVSEEANSPHYSKFLIE